MEVIFAIRCKERNDVVAMAKLRAQLVPTGFVEDKSRAKTCSRNGGLWQYRVPVSEKITA